MIRISDVLRVLREAPPLLIITLLFTLVTYFLIPLIYTDGWQFAKFLNEHDQPIALLTILVLGVVFYPFRQYVWIERLVLWLAANPLTIAIVVGIALALASYFVYQRWPVTMDEYSPWFQAHIFGSGALFAKYPLDTLNHLFEKPYHSNFFSINWTTGQVVSIYWPGFALLLSPFAYLGVPWLCNPVLVALSVVALHRLVARLGLTQHQQGWVILLAVASPAFTLNGMSFYSMPAHLLLNTLFALCLVNPNPLRLFLAGLVGGYALCLHNPLPHLAFALPWLIWYTFFGEHRLRRVGWLVAGYLPFSLLLGLGWVLVMREVSYIPQASSLTEFASLVLAEPKSLWVTLAGYSRFFYWPSDIILTYRLGGFFKLWLWAVPLLLALAIVGARRAQAVPIRLLVASALTMFFIYFFIPFDQGHGWGYRYFHPAWFIVPILAVIAMRNRDISTAFESRLAICTLASLIVITPIRAWQMGDFVAGHVAQVPTPNEAMTANECEILFHNKNGFYGIDMVENAPDLKGCRLTFISLGFAEDMAFAKSIARGGREVGRDHYGWVYRYPKNQAM